MHISKNTKLLLLKKRSRWERIYEQRKNKDAAFFFKALSPRGKTFPWCISKGQKQRRDDRLRPTRTPEPEFTLWHTPCLHRDKHMHTTHLYCMRNREAVYIGGYRILPLGTVGDSLSAPDRHTLQTLYCTADKQYCRLAAMQIWLRNKYSIISGNSHLWYDMIHQINKGNPVLNAADGMKRWKRHCCLIEFFSSACHRWLTAA